MSIREDGRGAEAGMNRAVSRISDADRHVDQEDAPPGPVADEQPAEDGPDDAADREDGREHSHGPVSLVPEVIGHDPGRRRHERPAAEGLDEPREQQHRDVGREPAAERGEGEDAAEIMKTFLRPYMSLIFPAIGMAMTWPSA
jgi:hypothetical protein